MEEVKQLADFAPTLSIMRQKLTASDKVPWPEGSECPECGYWFVWDQDGQPVPGVMEAIDYRMTHESRYQMAACKCEARQQERLRQMSVRFGNANLPTAVSINDGKPMRFTNFDVDDGNKEARSAAGDFVRGLTPHTGLVVVSDVGLGKSHLLAAMGFEIVKAGGSARYEVAGEMLDTLKSSFSNGSHDSLSDVKNAYHAYDVLMIDDLGMEPTTEWAAGQITSMIDYRYRHDRRFVIVTNLTQDIIRDQFGSRLADRLWDRNSGRIRRVYLQGESWRTR